MSLLLSGLESKDKNEKFIKKNTQTSNWEVKNLTKKFKQGCLDGNWDKYSRKSWGALAYLNYLRLLFGADLLAFCTPEWVAVQSWMQPQTWSWQAFSFAFTSHGWKKKPGRLADTQPINGEGDNAFPQQGQDLNQS